MMKKKHEPGVLYMSGDSSEPLVAPFASVCAGAPHAAQQCLEFHKLTSCFHTALKQAGQLEVLTLGTAWLDGHRQVPSTPYININRDMDLVWQQPQYLISNCPPAHLSHNFPAMPAFPSMVRSFHKILASQVLRKGCARIGEALGLRA
jgi:hypothetical protein